MNIHPMDKVLTQAPLEPRTHLRKLFHSQEYHCGTAKLKHQTHLTLKSKQSMDLYTQNMYS